jgi:hypothetical protein
MTTTPQEPAGDPDVVPSGDPSTQPSTDPDPSPPTEPETDPIEPDASPQPGLPG